MRAVGYCRFSSENQQDGFSIEAQQKAIREFCDKEGYEIVRFYVDEAKTGTTTEGRTSFLEMLSDSKKGEFQLVIVHKLDRFARNRVDSAVSKKVLKDNGVRLISVLEKLDDSPESIILESVLEGMNEYYSQNLSRETKKGMRIAGAMGRILGAIPFGYTADKDKKFVLVESEAEVVRYFFNHFAAGIPLITLEKESKRLGYKTKRGFYFSANTISHILKNPLYTGDYHFGEAIYAGVAPVIIDKELFAKAQTYFKPRVTPKDKGLVYLLTGRVFHSCGAPMVGYKSIKKGQEYFYYRCKNKEPGAFIKKKALEDSAITCLLSFLSDDKIINDVTKSINKRIKAISKGEDVDSLKKEYKTLEDKQSKLLDVYLSGIIDKDAYSLKKADLDLQMKVLSRKIKSCLLGGKMTPVIIKGAFDYYLLNIKNSLMDDSSLQAVISTFIKRITVFTDHIDVEFNFGDSTVAYKRDNAPALPSLVATFKYCGGPEMLRLRYESVKTVYSL